MIAKEGGKAMAPLSVGREILGAVVGATAGATAAVALRR